MPNFEHHKAYGPMKDGMPRREPAQRCHIPNLDSYHYVYNFMAMYNQFPQRFRYANHIIVFFDVSMKSASLCIFRKEPLTVAGNLPGMFLVVLVGVLFLRIISKLCREEAERKRVFGN
ncbi:hypothetical protein ARALYDRAFT_908049 [Arabidopsis lyrata subsp. lyrata]|uniref:Uncharacterized protein n=1 Tax=Arabidopsis lyrata subsp. lyrata TaxID=81972 RepID=D7M758_ARALL|nr:hypothetical protein ARALYDRAFT_908049 [Arabidopsis lyrata subsp. lyrata]